MNKITGIILFLCVGMANSSPEIKGNPDELRSYFHPEEKTLSIRDEAVETAYTDQAIVNLVVKTEDKLLSKSMNINSKLRSKITKILIQEGIEESNIKNSKFSSSPQYGWFGSKPDSYEVMNRVAIKIKTEKQLEAIAFVADNHSEITLSGTTFEHSKKSNFEQLVKEKALKKVLEKKQFYEKSLGVKLVPVSFSESDVDFNATHGANLLEEEVVVTGIRASKDSYSKKRDYAPRRENSFDEVKYRAVVTVEFKVN